MQTTSNAKTIIAVLLLLAVTTSGKAAPPTDVVFVADGVAKAVRYDGQEWTTGDGYLECGGTNNYLFADHLLGPGNFRVSVDLTILGLAESAATFVIGGSHFGFEGRGGEMFTEGSLLDATYQISIFIQYILVNC